MVDGVRRTGSSFTGRRGSSGRVDPADAARRTGSDAPQSEGRSVVVIEPRPRQAGAAGARSPFFTPYLAQLIVSNSGDGPSGERRSVRRPEAVAPRADATYKAADRLGSEIEPGFLYRRQA